MERPERVLVTGVTGYVGGRLAPQLIESGYQVRTLVRGGRPRVEGRPWVDDAEVVDGDVFKPETLVAAMEGVDVAYYLIHSMSGSDNFVERDIEAAQNFARAAAEANVDRIIYLGGLGDPDSELSEHLRSRQKTGDALRSTEVDVTEFRAAIVVGSGSISFEMIRYLTERVPIMICPQWVYSKVQPIAVRDLLKYLEAALTTEESRARIIEIGGSDVMTYGDMMRVYAAERGLTRFLVPVPVLTPRLSSYWVHLVTPITSDLAQPLIDGLQNEVIVREPDALELFPDIHPMGYGAAVQRALDRLNAQEVETAWSDARASSVGDEAPFRLEEHKGLIVEQHQRVVDATTEITFRTFTGLGGKRGWLYFSWAWWLRGLLDQLVGGVGLRRGRRHPDDLRVGDALDFWRVEAIEPNRLMRLRAEMKVPGRAWLQYETRVNEEGETVLLQTAFYAPKGLFGLLYWYALYAAHYLIFPGMIDQVKALAEEAQRNDARASVENRAGEEGDPVINRALDAGSTRRKERIDGAALATALALPFVAAAIGGSATSSSIDSWYKRLKKPSWNPPGWIFGPVWTLLYLLMGVASWLVWRDGIRRPKNDDDEQPQARKALLLYVVQLGFNALWSVLFFGRRRPDLAFAEIGLLLGLIGGTLRSFYQIRPVAGLLLVPYLLWTSFATLLNWTIWRLNR